MNTSDTLSKVVSDGIRFLESLTAHYGSERGMQIWEELGNVLGREVKGQIFFALMTGHTSTRVRFSTDCEFNTANKVAAVKAIRAAADPGLKETLDLVNRSQAGVVAVDCSLAENAKVLARELQTLGCKVY